MTLPCAAANFMQVTSASCVAAVQWPTPLHDYISPGRGDNVCCDDACLYRHIAVQYMSCSPDRVAVLGLHHVPQGLLAPQF